MSGKCSFFMLSGCEVVLSRASVRMDVLNCVEFCVKQSKVQCSEVLSFSAVVLV